MPMNLERCGGVLDNPTPNKRLHRIADKSGSCDLRVRSNDPELGEN